jgi:hypothetical protein
MIESETVPIGSHRASRKLDGAAHVNATPNTCPTFRDGSALWQRTTYIRK